MGRNDCMTLDEAIHEFEFDCKIRHLSPKTIDNYRKQLRYFERFLGNELSITSVEDVRPSHIKSFLSMMDDAGRKPQYINDLLKVYKTFFNYLETEGHIESSPAKRIRNMKLPKLKLRTFTEKNIMDMINYYNGRSFIEIRNRAMIAMMFDTGVRLSELMELVETQIHEESIMIYGKGAKERVVPVSPFLSKALLRYTRARESFFRNSLHDKEFFLSRTGKKLTAEAVAKMLKKAAKAVGVSEDIRVSPYTCRHTFAHLNLKNGIDLYTLSRLLGHESVSITQRYLEGITDEGVIQIARKSGVLENIR